MSPSPQSISDSPLTEATFLILLSLAQQPRHGYAILKDVASLSDGRVTLSTGTLYGVIHRLLQQGWIARLEEGIQEDQTAAETGRLRKSYTLTRLGRLALQAEAARIQSLAEAARLRTAGVEP
ncbi:MAG: PadR family transcriptional regulator [Anaerolineae bacterium]|nr:PadR family transcriptional regulator [Anaerolineae bacterium]